MAKKAKEVTEVEEVKKETKCGHVNKHHYGSDGRLQDISCELLKGHDGDHKAVYMKLIPDHITNNKGVVIEEHYREQLAETYWGDMAGTPASAISEKPMPQLTQFQKDILSDVLKKSPSLSIEAAIEQARSNPLWAAV